MSALLHFGISGYVLRVVRQFHPQDISREFFAFLVFSIEDVFVFPVFSIEEHQLPLT